MNQSPDSVAPTLSASTWSRWSARVARAHPEWIARIQALALQPLDGAAIAAILAAERPATAPGAHPDEPALRAWLRRARMLTLATLIERDLGGRAGLHEVMTAMTALAAQTIAAALTVLTAEAVRLYGVPRAGADAAEPGAPQDLIVVGMGKLGGGELNVSSDIDLIFVYGEDGVTDGLTASPTASLSNHEYFSRLGRRLIGALSEATADGFVFRVDMNLRPNGASGPLALSLDALEAYFVSQGRDWERFAWIKARIVSPPVLGTRAATAVDDDLDRIRLPFVYRRYLDFGALSSLRALHGLIRAEVARNSALRPDRAANVKLGRGGIREIEFIAQLFQLIRGGRDAELRGRSTLPMLALCARRGLLDAAVAAHLEQAYVLLRNVEHRLQYLDDAQTHALPTDPGDRERIAAMARRMEGAHEDTTEPFPDYATLAARLAHEQAFVAGVFDEVFGANVEDAAPPAFDAVWGPGLEASAPDAAALAALERCGYADGAGAWSRLRALWNTSRIRGLVTLSRERLDALMPRLLHAASQAGAHAVSHDTTVTLGRMLDLIEAIAGRAAYLALLAEYPQALERVARLMAASEWTARYLIRHPILLDELLDARTLFAAPDWPAVARALQAELEAAHGDVEREMDILRETHHAQLFRLLAQDLEGRLPVEVLADHLSALADLVLGATLTAAWRELPQRHRDVPAFAVIGYGKYGGKELGYASDLDVIFLYDDADERAQEIYARYAQRISIWLSSRTTAGALFEIDLALRPDGASGLLVSSFEAFRKYQRGSAWVWEHQALTRARFCAGDARLGAAFEAERRVVLALPRDGAALRRDIAAMRVKLREAHPNSGKLFDLKHDAGGMIDIEFCVQYLVLAHGATQPGLLDDVGNIALLARAADAGLIDAALARAVADAYRLYRRHQHALRLADARFARAEPQEFVAARAAVRQLQDGLFAAPR